jgi:hypothetical protein
MDNQQGHISNMNKKDSSENPQIEETKPRLDWNKEDVVFFSVLSPFAFLVALLILAPTGAVDYLSGRLNVPLNDIVFLMLMFPGTMLIFSFSLIIPGLPWTIILTVRSRSDWRRYTRRKILIRSAQIMISIFVMTVFVLAGFEIINSYSPFYQPFTSGFADRMKSKADVGAIRDWLKTLTEEHCTDGKADHSFGPWPKAVVALKPRYVNLDLDDKENLKVRLTWGGGFGHWGIEIGMPDMMIPPSDMRQYGEYRIPIQPGVYAWHELQ